MHQRKLMKKQIENAGVRIGDSCSIFPLHGKKKAFTLNRHCIDLISAKYRPQNLSVSYIELPSTDLNPFHYRLEIDKPNEGRFVMKTLEGYPFWLNGLAAREAYIERKDRLYIDDNKVNFDPFDLSELISRQFDHEVLLEQSLLESSLNILIQGETGTGKSHLAQKIHDKSGRSGRFVAVNLASYNPSLIESELFGHKKGSFTGAVSDKDGAFSEASGGTLFIDEIDSLPIDLQTKLLTFLDNKKFRKVGDTKENLIQARLIFASGRSLESLIQKNLFRRDFYFRLKSGHTIELLPLRNDLKKIREAIQFYSLTHHISLSQRLQDFYETLAWPGNLRQLFGHLDKKRVLSRSIKLDFDFQDEELMLRSSDLMSFGESTELMTLHELKEDYVRKAFALCEGNIALTARKLQVTDKTIKSLLSKLS